MRCLTLYTLFVFISIFIFLYSLVFFTEIWFAKNVEKNAIETSMGIPIRTVIMILELEVSSMWSWSQHGGGTTNRKTTSTTV